MDVNKSQHRLILSQTYLIIDNLIMDADIQIMVGTVTDGLVQLSGL